MAYFPAKPKFPARNQHNVLIIGKNKPYSNSLYWQQTGQLQSTRLKRGGVSVLKDRWACGI